MGALNEVQLGKLAERPHEVRREGFVCSVREVWICELVRLPRVHTRCPSMQ